MAALAASLLARLAPARLELLLPFLLRALRRLLAVEAVVEAADAALPSTSSVVELVILGARLAL